MRTFAISLIGICFCLIYARAIGAPPDGAFDPTFINGGRTTYAPTNGYNSAETIRELTDGRLLLGGNCASMPCLARLHPDGSLDQTYGPLQVGTATFTEFSGTPTGSYAGDMIALTDGRAVLAGCAENKPSLFIVRADGTGLDTSVGNNTGYFEGTQGAVESLGCAIRVRQQKDGKFIVLQNANDSTYGYYVLVTRIKADLSGLDLTFGNNGAAKIAFSANGQSNNDDGAVALEVGSDDDILTGGYAPVGNSSVIEFARLLPNGQLDPSFGGSGTGRIFISEGSTVQNRVFDIAIAPDRGIAFGGDHYNQATNSGIYVKLVGRLTPAGTLDAAFLGGLITDAPSNGALGTPRVEHVIATADSILAVATIPRVTGYADTYFEVTRWDKLGSKVSGFGDSGSSYSSFAVGDQSAIAPAAMLTTRGLVLAGSSISSVGSSSSLGVARLAYEHIFGDGFQ